MLNEKCETRRTQATSNQEPKRKNAFFCSKTSFFSVNFSFYLSMKELLSTEEEEEEQSEN